MTARRFLTLFRSRFTLIAAVFAASLLSGALMFFPQRKVYEVSMLVQNLNGARYCSANHPLTVREAIELRVLDKKIVQKGRLAGQNLLPEFQAGEVRLTDLVKIFVFVPSEEIDRTETTMNVLFEVLKSEFRRDCSEESASLDSKGWHLQRSGTSIGLAMKNAPSPLKLKKLSKNLAESVDASSGIRMASPPAASSSPADPSNMQVILAFGLLGFFAGLAAALWSDERESAQNNKP